MKSMGKMALIAAASIGLAAAGAASMAPQPPATEQARVQASAQQSKPVQQNQTDTQRQQMALREEEARRHVRATRSTTKHKNRRGGERAHRRWRFRKSSGRAA